MDRQAANLEIIEELRKIATAHPNLRLGQILVNAGVVRVEQTTKGPMWKNEFYTEPSVVLERMKQDLKRLFGVTEEAPKGDAQ